ncbi:ArsR/SmtB family transcription factor [Alkalihalobacillus pseudalcaliphilus]|uniref:ArsR/SmtB family transcription factor n=1 Tax=Alkalihalobacillus pseudalcaliphilus TaxID=79884 RepID=UPI00064DBAB5|nr:winged helix-turn-helix domain-containing protein [Alkalihalobacillus pseudalcaliphilus]KMK78145.1 hypothetical protein AB990_01520 [Alkalihalobacillus pseudalcaliphilus]
MEYRQMEINLKQQKLISNSLRTKIIYLLAEEAMTSKQVAEALGMSAGNIHYHIQQLYKNGILELTETRENKGINEKYYQAKATHFILKDAQALNVVDESIIESLQTNLDLTEEDLKELKKDYSEILQKYLKRSVGKSEQERKSYLLNMQIRKPNEGDGE